MRTALLTCPVRCPTAAAAHRCGWGPAAPGRNEGTTQIHVALWQNRDIRHSVRCAVSAVTSSSGTDRLATVRRGKLPQAHVASHGKQRHGTLCFSAAQHARPRLRDSWHAACSRGLPSGAKKRVPESDQVSPQQTAEASPRRARRSPAPGIWVPPPPRSRNFAFPKRVTARAR